MVGVSDEWRCSIECRYSSSCRARFPASSGIRNRAKRKTIAGGVHEHGEQIESLPGDDEGFVSGSGDEAALFGAPAALTVAIRNAQFMVRAVMGM